MPYSTLARLKSATHRAADATDPEGDMRHLQKKASRMSMLAMMKKKRTAPANPMTDLKDEGCA